MGARGFARTIKGSGRKSHKRLPRRVGTTTQEEKDLVRQFVMDQPGEIQPRQERSLALTMRRSPDTVRHLIAEAKLHLGEAVEHYVDVHRQAVDTALANGDAKSLEVAVRGSQWAMENIAVDGVRVIEQASKTPTGPRIMIGVRIGGANTTDNGGNPDTVVNVINGESANLDPSPIQAKVPTL